MATRKFKSESKKLLDMMINSIYTHKEIFLRELISNANDAVDKLYYLSLKDENISFKREDFYIRLSIDKDQRLLTITDTGIGMTKEELEDNLGTIAKSGSLEFKDAMDKDDDIDIIGKFGVGFYSAFMVSDCVSVTSKRFGREEAYLWQSKGADGYTVSPCEKDGPGTQIVLSIKKGTDDESYDEFLDEYNIKRIVKKYSDYIKYPIKMEVSKTRLKDGSKDEYETYREDEILNSMIPIWRKSKAELSDEDYNIFYKDKFHDYENPVKTIHTSAEGMLSYTALLYIPARPPFDYYTKDFEKGLQLYANGVLIMEKCPDLLPDYFGFVKGLADSPDLSLNISREILQHDRQLKLIAANLKKKIKNELLNMLDNDREAYETFYENFARVLKYGVYDNFGSEKEFLVPLIMFYSSFEKKLVTLKEYSARMKEEQKYIYYACGESVEKIAKLPQTEQILDKGYEILYLCDDVDEFAVKILEKFEDKEFKSISASDLGLENEEKPEERDANIEIFAFMKEALTGKVKDVKASNKLKSYPVCISTEGDISIEMEKVLNKMPTDNKVRADRVLEINVEHDIFKTIKTLYRADKDRLKKYADVLYNGALLIEGLSIEDPVDFSNTICELIK